MVDSHESDAHRRKIDFVKYVLTLYNYKATTLKIWHKKNRSLIHKVEHILEALNPNVEPICNPTNTHRHYQDNIIYHNSVTAIVCGNMVILLLNNMPYL